VNDPDLANELETMEAWRHMPETHAVLNHIPVRRLMLLLAKVVRFNRGGWTAAERREIAADLLEMASQMVDD
jgi:hypothetical protein